MHKQEWIELAEVFVEVKAESRARYAPTDDGLTVSPQCTHDRMLMRHTELDMIDRLARQFAKALKRRASRFDQQRFLRLAGVGAPDDLPMVEADVRARTAATDMGRMVEFHGALNMEEVAHVLAHLRRALDEATSCDKLSNEPVLDTPERAQ